MSFGKSVAAKYFLFGGICSLLGAGSTLYLTRERKFINDPSSEQPSDKALLQYPMRKFESRYKSTKELEKELGELKIVKELRKDQNKWKELPFSYGINEKHKSTSFVHSTLNEPDHLLLPPIMFVEKEKKEVVYIFYIGQKLCGHPGITHGGVQAILYDEAMARPAFLNLPRNSAFTAYLNINYKSPAFVNQILIMKCKLEETDGRKALVTASLENTDNTIISTAESLFVAPRQAELIPDRSKDFDL
ncbi:hypothetical protein BB560_001291 [Smittium megazygosporum]|uniref:Thioesterase domain-containing protein n=1 Tax=Smittium megazygosporum TaxID=133381 RepID=A0A2T9ZHZ4_9FUNG|nr:hypothetical protein BB560_001291 [Smittium megazygosporum]